MSYLSKHKKNLASIIAACLWALLCLMPAEVAAGVYARTDWEIDGVTIRVTATEPGLAGNDLGLRLIGAVADDNSIPLTAGDPVLVGDAVAGLHTVFALAGSATHDDIVAALNDRPEFEAEITAGLSALVDLPIVILENGVGSYEFVAGRSLQVTDSEATVRFDAGAAAVSATWDGGQNALTVFYEAGETTLGELQNAINSDTDAGLTAALPDGGSFLVPPINETTLAGGQEPEEPETTIEIIYPDGQDYASVCQEATVRVTVANPNLELSVYQVAVKLRLPNDFFYVGDTENGTYDNSGTPSDYNVVTWVIDELNAGAAWTADVTFKGSCQAADQQGTTFLIESWQRWPGDEDQAGTSESESDAIDMRQPILSMLIDDVDNPGRTTIVAAIGDEIGMNIRIRNSGAGDVLDGQVLYSLELKAGLELLGLEETAPSTVSYGEGSEPGLQTYTLEEDPETGQTTIQWLGRRIDGGEDAEFLAAARVVACEGLTAIGALEYGCADFEESRECLVEKKAESSVTIDLEQPEIAYTVDGQSPPDFGALNIDWCEGKEVEVVIENVGNCPARYFSLTLENLPPWVVVDTPSQGLDDGEGAVVERIGSTAVFTIVNADDIMGDGVEGDLSPGSEHRFTIVFDLSEGACTGDLSARTIAYQPSFFDCCGLEYNTGSGVQTVSTAPIQPSVAVNKTRDQQFIKVGADTVTWTIQVTYSHPTAVPGDDDYTITADITDIIPNASNTENNYGNFTLVETNPISPEGYVISDSAEGVEDRITWSNVTLQSGQTWTATITQDAPTIPCAGGNIYPNSVEVTTDPDPLVDCRGCEIPGPYNATASVVVHNADVEDAITAQEKTVDYDIFTGTNVNTNEVKTTGAGAVERGSKVRVTTVSSFSESAPDSWEDTDGDGRDIEFIELTTSAGARGLRFAAPGGGGDLKDRLELTVEYDGVDHTALIASSDVTIGSNGEIRINLSGLNGIGDGSGAADRPNDGRDLTVGMTLYAPEQAQSGITWSRMIVPVEGGQDPDCEEGREDYYVGANITTNELNLNISLTGPNTVYKTELLEDITIDVTNPTDWQPYDVRVELDLQDGYDYIPDSTQFSGWFNEDGNAITTFEPTIVNGILRWDFGDLDPARQPGEIRVDLLKLCNENDSLNARVEYNTNITNQPDNDITSRGKSSNASYSPAILTGGEMEVRLTPEIYYATDGYPRFRYYVINRGNGPMRNAWVTIDLDEDLYYLEGESLLDGSPITEKSIDGKEIKFRIDEIAPGQQAKLELNLRLQDGCEALDLRVDAAWGRSVDDLEDDPTAQPFACQQAEQQGAEVRLASTEVVVNQHFIRPTVIPACGEPVEMTIRVFNAGQTEVYNVRLVEFQIPDGMELVAGSVRYALSSAPGDFELFPGATGPGSPTSSVSDANGDLQELVFDFMNPADEVNEDNSIITATDGREADDDGLRHFVLKSTDYVIVKYQLRVKEDCEAAARFTDGDKRFRARAEYDLPCQRLDDGSEPTQAGATNTLTRPVANPDVTMDITGRNQTKDVDYGAATIFAEKDDEVWFDITIRNQGNWRAQNTYFTFELPPGMEFVALEMQNANPASMVLEEDVGTEQWHIDRDGNGHVPASFADGYLDGSNVVVVDYASFIPPPGIPSTTNDDEFIAFRIRAEVTQCVDAVNTFTTTWGCCPNQESAGSGSIQQTRRVRADAARTPEVTLREVPGNGLTVLGGEMQVEIHNPDPQNTFTLYDLDLRVELETLPAGYEYDGSVAPVVDYSGAAALRTGKEWTNAEEQPFIDDNVLLWASNNVANGQIDPERAVLFPGETITINYRLKNTGEEGYVDDDVRNIDAGDPPPHRNDNDNPNGLDYELPTVTFRATLDTDNRCGQPQPQAIDILNIEPEEIDVDIISMTANTGLAEPGDAITWTIELFNRSSHDAPNVEFTLDIGDGYDDATYSFSIAPDSIINGTRIWPIGTLPAQTTYTIVVTATVGDIGTGVGDLSLTGNLTAETEDAAGNLTGHLYVQDYIKNYVPGVLIDKKITNVNEPGEITDEPDNQAATSSIGNAVTYELTVNYLAPGQYAGVEITDNLDFGGNRMEFVSARLVSANAQGADDVSGTPAPTYSDGTVTMLPAGGSFTLSAGTATFVFEIKARIANQTANQGEGAAAAATVINNRMEAPFTYDSMSYTAADYPDILRRGNVAVTVVEPYVDDDNFNLFSVDPACESLVVENQEIEYQVQFTNTGSSPMYNTELRHLLDVGKRQTPAKDITVEVDNGGGARTLVADTDYTITHDAGDQELIIEFLVTDDARIAPDETVTVTYVLTVDAGIGADQFLEDEIRLTYTSLPDDGDQADGEEEQRVSGFGASSPNYPLSALECRHQVEQIDPLKTVEAAITEPGGAQAAANNAQIGEELTYVVSITVPAETTVYDLRFSDLITDGLTVTDAFFQIDQGAAQTIAFAQAGDGTTEIATPAQDEAGAIGTVDGGAEGVPVAVTIVVRVNDTYNNGQPVSDQDTFDNLAEFTWDLIPDRDPDEQDYPMQSRQSNEVTTTILEPELALTKVSDVVDDPPHIIPEQVIQYTVTVINNGTGTAYNIVIRDVLPWEFRDSFVLDSVEIDGVGLVENDDYNLAYDLAAGEILIELTDAANAALAPGSSLVVRYTVTAPNDLGAGKTGALAMVNDATVPVYYSLPENETDEPDHPRRQYDQVGPVTVVLTTPDAEIAKQSDPQPGVSLEPGDIITYTLTAPDPALATFCYFFEVRDTLPDGMEVTVVNITVTPDVPDPGNLTTVVEPATAGGRNRVVTITGDLLVPGQRIMVEIEAEVQETFDNGTNIPSLHNFENFGLFSWHDEEEQNNRLSTSSLRVIHPFSAEGIVFEPDNWATALPGTVVFHRHILRNYNQEEETEITFAWPAASAGWEWLLYLGDGDGNPVGSPLTSGGSLQVPGTGHATDSNQVEIIMRAQVPQGTPPFTVDILQVTAEDTKGNQGVVTDTTVVQEGQVRIVKEASLDGTNYFSSLEVKPGQQVYQRLRFINIGTQNLREVVLFDVIPSHSSYVAGSATDGGGELTIAYSTDGGATYQGVEPAASQVASLRWEYQGNGGELEPGIEKQVIFRIEIR